MRSTIILGLMLLIAGSASGQKYPERRDIRSGNKLYEKGDYTEAEVAYRRALEKNAESYEANFNLADALYKQKRYDEAAQMNAQLAADSAYMENAAAAYFNQGNALFQQRKLEEALEAYKNCMRLDPNDQQAKFNYAYTKKLLEKDNQNQQQNNQNNQQNNQENQQDQNKDQNDNQQDQNKNQQDQNKDKNQDQKDQNNKQNDQNDQNQQNDDKSGGQNPDQQQDQNQQPQPQNGGMSREEAERMLDAVQGSEDNTKKKVDAQKVRAVGASGKNW